MSKIILNGIQYAGNSQLASNINFTPGESGLHANVQDAIGTSDISNIGDSLTGAISNLNSTLKWEVDHYSDVSSIASYAQQINEADKVRCIKLKNGARIITGCVIINGQITNEPIFTVPQEFVRNGYPMQAWVCGVSSNKSAYMFLFNESTIYPWGVLPSVGDYISFYIVY